MGGSFVLRDRGGRPAGYVMQGMGVVRCRAGALAQPGQLVLLRAGETECRPMPADGQEQVWPDRGGALMGAYIASDGALLLDTGEAARQAFERARCRTPDAKTMLTSMTAQAEMGTADQPKETARPSQERAQESKEASVTSKEAAVTSKEAMPQRRSLPQRRWPPPPCWQEARYIDGQWQTPVHHESD